MRLQDTENGLRDTEVLSFGFFQEKSRLSLDCARVSFQNKNVEDQKRLYTVFQKGAIVITIIIIIIIIKVFVVRLLHYERRFCSTWLPPKFDLCSLISY